MTHTPFLSASSAGAGAFAMLDEFEKTLGWRFSDKSLVETALTAPAYKMDHPGARDNQRLEFLGDAVFGLLSADYLYRKYPDCEEGRLTAMRTALANGGALAIAAERVGLRRYLRMNDAALDLPVNAKTLADAMEAVIAAAWLDGGIEAAKKVFSRLAEYLAPLEGEPDNPKGDLAEFADSIRIGRPVYEILKIDNAGTSAQKYFVRVLLPDGRSADGIGHSKRRAEMIAARELLKKIRDEK